jgi:4-diphosphocytidyl-2-C-methyl-D-erythritol kinase
MHPSSGAWPAPAKLNLALHIIGRRGDGYHLLESLSVLTAFGDTLHVAPSQEDRLTVAGPYAAEIPAGADNLVARARDLLRTEAGGPAEPVHLHLVKNIPVMSGVGGGSSDAAATLRALSRLWGMTSPPSLSAIAERLGADVPMCLAGRAVLARGIGERIEPVELPPLHLVLVNPGVGVSTPAVFARLARRDNPPLPPLPVRPDAAGLVAWLAGTRNDMLAAALDLAPQIGTATTALLEHGASFARMSGSGATCFGIFPDAAAASGAAQALKAAHPGWFVVATGSIDMETQR